MERALVFLLLLPLLAACDEVLKTEEISHHDETVEERCLLTSRLEGRYNVNQWGKWNATYRVTFRKVNWESGAVTSYYDRMIISATPCEP